jgi:acyl carrier protein
MQREEILAKLQVILKENAPEQVDWTTVNDETPIETMGIDSLFLLDLLFDLEDAFGVHIEAKEVVGIKTIGEMVSFLDERIES